MLDVEFRCWVSVEYIGQLQVFQVVVYYMMYCFKLCKQGVVKYSGQYGVVKCVGDLSYDIGYYFFVWEVGKQLQGDGDCRVQMFF